jgi:hypothetical protein
MENNMNTKAVEIIRKHIKVLEGARFFIAGRTAAMAWLGFVVDNINYALHLQSGFRVRTKEKLLIANLDMFDPTDTVIGDPSFAWEQYDWDIQGNNCYDEWTQRFGKESSDGIVRAVEVSDFGDLTIEIDNGMIIEVFVNSSTQECWRFFERGADHHLVVTGLGPEADR